MDVELLRYLRVQSDYSWQVKVLRHADGVDAAVILSMLAHAYDVEGLLALLPDFVLCPPFLGTCGKIDKRGRVCADIVFDDRPPMKQQPLYASEFALRDAMRRLADRLKLTDADRSEMFDLIRRWIVCDFRLDPTMDPADPDAKRLVAN